MLPSTTMTTILKVCAKVNTTVAREYNRLDVPHATVHLRVKVDPYIGQYEWTADIATRVLRACGHKKVKITSSVDCTNWYVDLSW